MRRKRNLIAKELKENALYKPKRIEGKKKRQNNDWHRLLKHMEDLQE